MDQEKNLLPFDKKKREVAILRNAETSPKFGKNPEDRTARELLDYGIAIIDKPSGPTSHQVSFYVKQLLHIEKCGHSGTLDPQVTGVLPIALGRGTRVVQALLPAGKEYVCLMHLHAEIPKEKLLEVFSQFSGRIKQLPPKKSAVKRQWRERNVYYLELLDLVGQDVLFRVGCQAGTYIRKLCHDIGTSLGIGAHMLELRRTKAGPFAEDQLCTLQELTDAFYYYTREKNESYLKACILPFEAAVSGMPKVFVLDSTVDSLCHGASLKVPGIAKLETGIVSDELVAVLTLKGELIGLGNAKLSTEDMQKSSSGISVILNQVFMQPGVYPKMERK